LAKRGWNSVHNLTGPEYSRIRIKRDEQRKSPPG
jgi:hypothetical protein